MTDIRGRHAKYTDISGSWCLDCNKSWPCDAITEHEARLVTADLFVKAEAALAGESGRLADWKREAAYQAARADKAEAALAEAMSADPLDALKALDAARADAERLAVELNECARDAHSYGPVSDHWGTPIGDGPCDFDVCDDRFCEAARAALAAHDEATEVTLMEVSIVHTDAAPGEMDEHGAWGFKKAVAYTNVTNDDWVIADD